MLPETSVRSASLQGFESLVLKLDKNPVHILESVGLSPAMLREADTMVPYARVADLLELAAQACDEPCFGLKLGKLQGLATLGALGLILAQQPTLRQAVELARRHMHLHAHGANIGFQTYETAYLLRFSLELPRAQQTVQLEQLSVSLMLRVLQALTDPAWRPQKILLQQDGKADGDNDLEQELGCELAFNQAYNGIAILGADLDRKPRADQKLLERYFSRYLQEQEARFPNQLSARIRNALLDLLPTGECSLENIAATQGVQARVLQKRLQKENTSFRELLEQVRSDLACNRLRYSAISITDLALDLGYSEVAVFSRSFKRWTGMTPNAWRRKADPNR